MATTRGQNAGGPGPQAARFGAAELAIVLSHYEIGVIRRLRGLPRGSSRSPKAVVESSGGAFVLKRRAPGLDDPYRVAFDHDLQLHLLRKGYPGARLIGTRTGNNSMLVLDGRVYELFEFVRGERCTRTPAQTTAAGRALATWHAWTADHASSWPAPRVSFHRSPGVVDALAAISNRDGAGVAERLRERYERAGAEAARLGFDAAAGAYIHGDWHPGNLLFRNGHLAAVLDYDGAKRAPRVIDVANGVLQFSMAMPADRPLADWPLELDTERATLFVRAYGGQGSGLSRGEVEAIPWLALEALIAEAVFPVAATGRFARFDGLSFLAMVDGKAGWIEENSRPLADAFR